jgi:anti-sigma factor RsiW
VTALRPEGFVCKDVVEVVSEYLDGAMTPVERARLEQHLLVCPPCSVHVDQMRSTIDQIAKLRAGDPDAGPALVELFREWKREQGE